MNTLQNLILSNEDETLNREVKAYQEKLTSKTNEIPIWERQWLTIEELRSIPVLHEENFVSYQTHRVVLLQYGWETKFTS